MLLLAALLALVSPAPSPAPDDIYRSALARLASLPQPPFIDTTEHRIIVSETPNGNVPAAWNERVLYDSTARRECVLILPYSGTSQVVFSQSFFAPDMWLVHHTAVAAAPHAGAPAKAQQRGDFTPDLSDLKVIASVVSVAKPSYHIRLAGSDKLSNGGTAYHMVLEPLANPAIHNLRELWVDASNFNIMRAVIDAKYAPDPGAPVEPTTVAEDFSQVGPYWIVIHRTWTYRALIKHILVHFDSTETNMSFPRHIPAWYFDEAQFNAHRAEVNLTSEWP